ncbi:MAG: sigma-54 interaction domain-containing protein [Longimicrobiales bacterium]
MAETVLITTHDLETAVSLRDAFEGHGFRVELLTPAERIGGVRADVALIVITGGLEEKRARRLVREAGELGGIPVLGLATSADAVMPDLCRRLGLSDCLPRSADPGDVALLGRRVLARRRLREVTGIVGETEAMHEVLERVVQIAPVNTTVLVTGESGTGKELVARGIHALSSRRARRFIAANVAALPETLLESELFGHEKGAFTGAVAQRKGLFELADHGTLFLDEIGEMALATQTKLLRVLEDHRFMRVGGEEPIDVDVRVIAATNRDLRQLVEFGDFRRDLYYRLNVLNIRLPPLRERKADIPLLLESFLRQFAEAHARERVALSPEALAVLEAYAWPGNVRELRNLIESMVVLAPGTIVRREDLPEYIRAGSRRPALLPAPRPPRVGGAETAAPELEFIFRMLVEMRLDLDDIRREFEDYRRRHPDLPPAALPHAYPALARAIEPGPGPVEVTQLGGLGRAGGSGDVHADEKQDDEDGGVVVFRPGQSMRDLERAAILAALNEVAGNRRKASEMLGIGERTLYRKLKEYQIEL